MALSDVRLSGSWNIFGLVRSDGQVWAVGDGYGHGYIEQDPASEWFEDSHAYPWKYLGQSNGKKYVVTNDSDSSGLLLKKDGTVWAIGDNENYAGGNTLGLGSRNDTWNGTDYDWVRIPGLTGIIDLEVGAYTVMALKDDGRLYGWGDGDYFQLDSAGSNARTPVQVHGLDDVIDFSLGDDFVTVVRAGGTLWTWGLDQLGNLGQGVAQNTEVDHPVQVATGVERVECGLNDTLFTKAGGALWGMGFGNHIGAGDFQVRHDTPIALPGPGNVSQFSAGSGWSIAINASTGRVWTAGLNFGSNLVRPELDGADGLDWGQITGPGSAPVVAVDVYAAAESGLYVQADCSVFAWGANWSQMLGTIKSQDEVLVPAQIVKNTNWEYDAWDGNIIDYDQSNIPFETNSVVLTDTGAIYQWGANLTQEDEDIVNAAEQPGDPGYDSGVAKERPTLIDTFPGAVRIGCIPDLMYVIKDDGTLWRKGTVSNPDLFQIAAGNYSTAFRGRLTDGWEQVPGMTNITDISCGGEQHAMVQDGDGLCYALGWSEYGALGLNAPHDDVTRPYRTWAPDGVEIDAAGAVASMSGGKIQSDWHGCYCAYPPLGIHHTGIWNGGSAYHESATSACLRVFPSDWFGGLNNVVTWYTTNAFPTIFTDYGIGYRHGVYIVSGVAFVAGINNEGEIGNGQSQNGLTLQNEAWWSDDDLTNISGLTFEPFDEPGPVCFKGTTTPISDFTEVLSVGYSGMFLRRANGEVWGWGTFPEALGDPTLPYEETTAPESDFAAFSSNGGWAIHIPVWDDFDSINMNYYGGLAQKDDGTLWGWGDALQAGQGYNDSTYYSPPVPVFPGEPRATDANFLFACDDPLENGADDEGPPVDGRPPDTVPNEPLFPPGPGVVPVPPPSGGGCRASMDGPSSCNFDVPIIDDFPMPDDEIEFPDFDDPELPDFTPPDFPIDEIDFPDFPPIGCSLPNFGNLADCKPHAGTGGGLPGGRDKSGKRGSGHVGVKLGGPTYNKRRRTFNQDFPLDPDTGEPVEDPDTGEPVIPPQRSWPAGSSVMTAITVILLDLGISPLKIIFEIGPEWDKTFGPKTFPTTTPMFAAAEWLAQLIMCRIIDEGSPTGNIYIGPPTHSPHSQTWTFVDYFPNPDDNPPFFNIVHGYSSTEAYFAVKVWGAHFSPPKFALVDTIFANDPQNLLEIEVGPDYSPGDAQDLANYRAALIRQAAVSIQITVPYNEGYFMRDEMVVQATSRGYQESYTLFGKQSDVSLEGNTHILTGVLPATLEMLANFPDVLEEPEPVGVAFLDAPEVGSFAIRPETKRKAEGRVQRQLERWAIREGVKATMNGSR